MIYITESAKDILKPTVKQDRFSGSRILLPAILCKLDITSSIMCPATLIKQIAHRSTGYGASRVDVSLAPPAVLVLCQFVRISGHVQYLHFIHNKCKKPSDLQMMCVTVCLSTKVCSICKTDYTHM